MFEIKGKYTTAKVMIDSIDETTMAQIVQMVNHPAFTKPISIMPDCHAGSGSVIGFTMEVSDKVIPNVIGVGLNCGMMSFNMGKNLFVEITKRHLDSQIRKVIPFGQTSRKDIAHFNFDWKNVNERIRQFTMKFNRRFGVSVTPTIMTDGGGR